MCPIDGGRKRTARSLRFASIFGLAFLLLATSRTSLAQKSDSVPQTVSLYLTVGTDGKLIRGLPAANFRLYEDGKARPFKLEEPETPVTIALLVEYSAGSWPYFEDIAYAMQGFMDEAPEGNWYGLATFANDSKVEVDFTKQHGKILQAFYSLGQPMWREINTYDAIYKMLERMGGVKGRRVLIFIGSGFDTFSSHTADDVFRKMQSTNVVVYCVGAGSLLRGRYEAYLSANQRMNLLRSENFLKYVARKSGGDAWFPRFGTAFQDVMKGVIQDIESQYRIVYSPQVPADGKLHKIKVEAFQVVNDRRQDFKVRVREGWRF
ncbi:MAG: VWA domain-containing protein, partial [Acidobacteriota bacterium]